ncbi:MAG: Ig-like domain-containing protein [Prevotellaceae bacterium]|jgi:hypothetical protein|nr:Ig-like domain-containing protein [Prevotellaceae bacterium]
MKINNYIKITCLLVASFLLASCEKEAEMTGITVDRESLSLQLGNYAQITVNPIPAGIDVDTRTYEWSSDNEAIAIVTPFGVVQTVEEGTCNITVKHGAFSKTIPITITDPVQLPPKKASWLFDDAATTLTLLKAEVGNPLQYGRRMYDGVIPSKGGGTLIPFDTYTSTEIPAPEISGVASVNGPKAGNGAIQMQPKYFLFANHGISANAGTYDGKVNEYTIMLDIYMPHMDGSSIWHPLIQTQLNGESDTDVWANNAGQLGCGSSGYSDAAKGLQEKTWYRVVVSAKCGTSYKFFINGEEVLNSSSNGEFERFALDPAGILFFEDDNRLNVDADIICSGLAMWDVALDDDQVKKLERVEPKLR